MYSRRSKTPKGCPEINIPHNLKKAHIFADFETFLFTDGFPLWEYRDKENFSDVLASRCEVVPWLLAANLPNVYKTKDGKKKIDEEQYVTYVSPCFPHAEFFSKIKEIWDLGFLPVIWFHNASYDLTACIETAFKVLDPDLKIYFTTKQNKNFLTGYMESEKYGFKAKFGDTLLYKRISLEAIGQMFNVPKGSIPYTMMDLYIKDSVVHFTDWNTGRKESIALEYCVKYVKRDVELLQLYHNQLTSETELITLAINRRLDPKVKTTTQGVHARSLLDLWLHRQHNGKFSHMFKFPVSEAEGKLMQRSLTGGFTSLNKRCLKYICDSKHLITSYDCNSMYPFVMTLGLPCGALMDAPAMGIACIEWVCVTCTDAHWKGVMEILKTDPIPINRQGYKEHENERIYVPRQFLEFVKENSSGTFKEHFSKYQKVTNAAGDFVNYIYQLRKDLRIEHTELARQIENGEHRGNEEEELARLRRLQMQETGVKTTINSLYGKMCEKVYLGQTVYVDGKFKIVEEDCVEYHSTLTGAYISLTGRLILYLKIKKVIETGFTFLYADTDSVKFAYPKAQEHLIEDIFGHNDGSLGQWKREGSWNEYWSPGKKKKYALINLKEPRESKFTLSGISENPYITALKNGLIDNREKTLQDIRYIFSPTSNVLFMNAKSKSVKTIKYDQMVIHNVNVSSNSSLGKLTGEVYMKGDKYVLKRYGQD